LALWLSLGGTKRNQNFFCFSWRQWRWLQAATARAAASPRERSGGGLRSACPLQRSYKKPAPTFCLIPPPFHFST
jgi:hypothetical protein